MKRETLQANMSALMKLMKEKRDIIKVINSLKERGVKITATTEFSSALKILNSILTATYGIKIKSTDRHKAEEYKLEHNEYFIIDGRDVKLRCITDVEGEVDGEVVNAEEGVVLEAQNEGIDTGAVYDALNVDPEFVQESDEVETNMSTGIPCLNNYFDECFRDDDDDCMYYDTGLVE